MNLLMKEMKSEDWKDVSAIYQEGINTQIATFQTQLPSYEEWDQTHIKCCRFIALNENEIVGWTALSPVSSRCVYAGVAEVSVYVKENYRGKHIGELLLKKLIAEAEVAGYWTLQSGIVQINTASIALHRKVGFRMVGYREKIAKDCNGNWQNTVLMERRSSLID